MKLKRAFRFGIVVPLVASIAAGGLLVSALTAQAAVTPTVTAVIQDGSNNNIATALIGTAVHANVLVASSTATTSPQGTVDFSMFGNGSCSGGATIQSGVTLVNGSANSATTTLTASGLSYKVHYNGQTDQYTTADSNCVSLAVNQQSPTISNTLSSTSITVGSSVFDSATLNGAFANASGTVAYKIYTNNSCTANQQNAGSVAVTNASVPNSTSIQFNTPGTYYWQAVYSGDTNNLAATSTCGAAVLTVNPVQQPATTTPTISTSLSSTTIVVGSSVYDSASLSGALASASGTVAYRVYTNNACTLNMQDAGTKTVTNATVPSSNSIQFNTAGTYYWQAVYSGDSLNGMATSSCGSEVLTVTSATTTPPSGGAGTISGTVFNDLNSNDVKNPGDPGLPGWTVWLHKQDTVSKWWMKWSKHDGYNDPIVATAVTDANGNYSFGNLGAGTYYVEEQEQAGWTQTTDDMTVNLATADSSGHADFANVVKGSGNDGNDHHGNGGGDNNGGKGHHGNEGTSTSGGGKGDNNDDQGSDSGNNGNHWGQNFSWGNLWGNNRSSSRGK